MTSSDPSINVTPSNPSIDMTPSDPGSPKQGMPPAFAELLATLTKKRPNRGTPRLSPRGTPRLSDRGTSRSRETPSSLKLRKSPQEAAVRERRDSIGTINNNGDCDTDCGDCYKLSENLMRVFDKAEAVFVKQKEMLEVNDRGFDKLCESFQTLHDRISRMQLTNHAHEMKTITVGSPVFELLREYSDKLVGLVHNQLDRTETV
uniref:Uncharacterized protein n=1 Tax=Ciona intestinalis TaxID=7719 RepID=F6SID7_CIOIN